jgi:hypothetical protein
MAAAAAVCVIPLGGCGSGGAAAPMGHACEGGILSLQYSGAVSIFDIPVPDRQIADARLGVAGSNMASLSDASGACATPGNFDLTYGALPAGVALDATTGAVSGTPTAVGIYSAIVRFVPSDASGSVQAKLEFQVADPALAAYRTWGVPAGGGALPASGRLVSMGSALVLAESTAPAITFARSDDLGASWHADAALDLSPARASTAISGDGATGLYLVAGRDSDGVLQDDVWHFDGLAWQQRAAHAPFGPRAGMTVFVSGGAVWVIGGSDGVVSHADVWRSDDAGASWTRATDALYDTSAFEPATSLACGGDAGGTPVVLLRQDWQVHDVPPGTSVLRSTNGGTTWQPPTLAAHAPVGTLGGTTGQCVSSPQGLFVAGREGVSASYTVILFTADGIDWALQPVDRSFDGLTPEQGGAVLGGNLFLGFGGMLHVTGP